MKIISIRAPMLLSLTLVATVLGACAPQQPDDEVRIVATDTGYTLTLPAEVMNGFPEKKTIRIVVDDPSAGKTEIKGIGTRVSDRSLTVETGEKLAFLPSSESVKAAGGTWIMLSLADSSEPLGCSGCPRAADLEKWRGNANLCWCWAE